EWLRLRDLYNMDFSNKLTFDPSLMYTALVEGQVDLISAYTTDGRVAAFDLVLLEDPRNALLAYDAMLLVSDAAASNPAFMRVVDSIIDSISDASMRQANRLVDVDGESVNAAIEYLRSRMLSN
ncbi:MAG: ABC transporter permease, partial [Gammaproteobacteria bacterium]|nr:ABC transporter permease [Gammaproteobacteria bacterium]